MWRNYTYINLITDQFSDQFQIVLILQINRHSDEKTTEYGKLKSIPNNFTESK